MTRLRQAVLVADALSPTAEQLESELGVADGFHDPGVGEFGLTNVVYAIGGCFLEIVAPIREGTTAGRLLDRDGSGGYMAIFQTDDLAAVRERVTERGIRTVWSIELDDIAAMHLHPKDIGGAIVSVDQPDPPGSWRWGGPQWMGDIPVQPTGLLGITVRVDDPEKTATLWAEVLGERADGSQLVLDDGRQVVKFVGGEGRRGVCGIDVVGSTERTVEIGGVTFGLR